MRHRLIRFQCHRQRGRNLEDLGFGDVLVLGDVLGMEFWGFGWGSGFYLVGL